MISNKWSVSARSFLSSALLTVALILGGPISASAGDATKPDSLQSAKQAEQQAEAALSNARNVMKMARDIHDAGAMAVATEAIQIAEKALKKARKFRREVVKKEAMRRRLKGGDLSISQRGDLAVRIKDPQTASVDPSFFTHPRARLHIRYVPNPMQAPKGTWLRYVKSNRASLILDALEVGKGDLDQSIAYLDGQIIRHGSNRTSSSALSYLEGLRKSYIAAGAEYRKRVKGNGQAVTVESKALLQAILAASGARKWPGPKNPNPGDKPLNPDDWRVKRANKMHTVLKATSGDLEKSYHMLRSDKDRTVASDAEYYLRGSYAYWDFLATKGGKK